MIKEEGRERETGKREEVWTSANLCWHSPEGDGFLFEGLDRGCDRRPLALARR